MTAPYYCPLGSEIEIFEKSRERKLPLMIKGPTGCGKSRFVSYMAARTGQSLIKVACNEDTTASDLIGRFLIKGNETVWQDGPVTRAVRQGGILYLDEIAEAREDVIVVLHSLSDDRRELYIDRTNEQLVASADFMLLVSYNPGYQSHFKEMKPSTRQRFITLEFNFPSFEKEVEILVQETGITANKAERLVKLAGNIRSLKEYDLRETVSTRLLVNCCYLIQSGVADRLACEVAIVQALADDAEVVNALKELVALKI